MFENRFLGSSSYSSITEGEAEGGDAPGQKDFHLRLIRISQALTSDRSSTMGHMDLNRADISSRAPHQATLLL